MSKRKELGERVSSRAMEAVMIARLFKEAMEAADPLLSKVIWERDDGQMLSMGLPRAHPSFIDSQAAIRRIEERLGAWLAGEKPSLDQNAVARLSAGPGLFLDISMESFEKAALTDEGVLAIALGRSVAAGREPMSLTYSARLRLLDKQGEPIGRDRARVPIKEIMAIKAARAKAEDEQGVEATGAPRLAKPSREDDEPGAPLVLRGDPEREPQERPRVKLSREQGESLSLSAPSEGSQSESSIRGQAMESDDPSPEEIERLERQAREEELRRQASQGEQAASSDLGAEWDAMWGERLDSGEKSDPSASEPAKPSQTTEKVIETMPPKDPAPIQPVPSGASSEPRAPKAKEAHPNPSQVRTQKAEWKIDDQTVRNPFPPLPEGVDELFVTIRRERVGEAIALLGSLDYVELRMADRGQGMVSLGVCVPAGAAASLGDFVAEFAQGGVMIKRAKASKD